MTEENSVHIYNAPALLPVAVGRLVQFLEEFRSVNWWPKQPQQQHDENTERVALQRRLEADDQWLNPHNLYLMMFSPSSAHIAPFCPNNGADAARQYASVDGVSYATFPFRKPCARPPYYSQDVRISPPAQNVADLIPSIGVSTQVNLRSGIIWRAIGAVSRNF